MYNVYGITDDALVRFWFYLTGRVRRVVIEYSVSVDQEIGFRVTQGSVLGTKIYCMYTKPVGDIIQRYGLSRHSYAITVPLIFKIFPYYSTYESDCKVELYILCDIDDFQYYYINIDYTGRI